MKKYIDDVAKQSAILRVLEPAYVIYSGDHDRFALHIGWEAVYGPIARIITYQLRSAVKDYETSTY